MNATETTTRLPRDEAQEALRRLEDAVLKHLAARHPEQPTVAEVRDALDLGGDRNVWGKGGFKHLLFWGLMNRLGGAGLIKKDEGDRLSLTKEGLDRARAAARATQT